MRLPHTHTHWAGATKEPAWRCPSEIQPPGSFRGEPGSCIRSGTGDHGSAIRGLLQSIQTYRILTYVSLLESTFISIRTCRLMNRGSSVDTVTGYGSGVWGVGVWVPISSRIIISSRTDLASIQPPIQWASGEGGGLYSAVNWQGREPAHDSGHGI
jgi:hypothetical protein